MDRIIGQERAIEVLQSALQSGRLHHAFIFHGPAGVGKFTTAVAFARTILCHEPQRELTGRIAACGSCDSCRLIPSEINPLAVAHPDLHVVVKELAILAEAREEEDEGGNDDKGQNGKKGKKGPKLRTIPVKVLIDHLVVPVGRTSQLRHGKVFIIDEAELISERDGQGRLLKTLEEPPAGTFIILVTASEDKLLPTIRSRCQRVAFLPLSDEAVERWAEKHLDEAKEWPAAQRQWLVEFAGGSLGRAALAVQYNLAAWARSVLPAVDQMAQGKFPVTLGQEIAQQLNAFAERWVEERDNASKEAANKLAGGLMWAMISQHARRKLAAVSAKLPANDPAAGEAALAPWLGVIEALAAAEAEIASNVNLGLAADHLVSRMYRALSSWELPVGS